MQRKYSLDDSVRVLSGPRAKELGVVVGFGPTTDSNSYIVKLDCSTMLLQEDDIAALFELNNWQLSWAKQLSALEDSAYHLEQFDFGMNYLDVYSEFSVALNRVPRQTGKTTFLMNQNIPNSLYITPTQHAAQRFRSSGKSACTIGEVLQYSRGRRVSCILLDDYRQIMKGAQTVDSEAFILNTIEAIYPRTITEPENFFIFGLTT